MLKLLYCIFIVKDVQFPEMQFLELKCDWVIQIFFSLYLDVYFINFKVTDFGYLFLDIHFILFKVTDFGCFYDFLHIKF